MRDPKLAWISKVCFSDSGNDARCRRPTYPSRCIIQAIQIGVGLSDDRGAQSPSAAGSPRVSPVFQFWQLPTCNLSGPTLGSARISKGLTESFQNHQIGADFNTISPVGQSLVQLAARSSRAQLIFKRINKRKYLLDGEL